MGRIAAVLLVAVFLVVAAFCSTFVSLVHVISGNAAAAALWLAAAVGAVLVAVLLIAIGRDDESDDPD